MKKKCNSCGYKNESCIEVGGIGMCRSCGSQLYTKNKSLKTKKLKEK